MGKTGLTVSTDQIHDLKAALDEHAMVAISDPQGKIIYVNDRFCADSKYSRQKLAGQNQRLINGSEPKFPGGIWKPPGQGTVWKGEITNKAKDGSLYRTDTTLVPFFDVDGKPRQCVIIGVEITGLSREVNRTLLDDFPALIRRANTEAKCDYFNRSWLEFTGRREQETDDLKAARDEHAGMAIISYFSRGQSCQRAGTEGGAFFHENDG